MNDDERERLERRIYELEGIAYRQTVAIIKLHGGEVRSHLGRDKRRGRPKGSGDVSAARIMAAHRRLHDALGKHVTQQALAEEVGVSIPWLKYLLKRYGLGWPLE